MALWGNNDAVGSGGTVSLDYTTRVVTGSGTTFGETGAAQEGDVIRFGDRSGQYHGDAVIVSIASTISCTIDSTAGLSGNSIAGTSFYVSQLPKYTVLDSSYSDANFARSGFDIVNNTATSQTGYGGTTDIPVLSTDNIFAGDQISGPTWAAINVSSVGIGTTYGAFVRLSSAIGAAATVTAGAALTVSREIGGYDKYAYGVSQAGSEATLGTQFETGVGWVGVTTYKDESGNLRVKKEILVAMSGITTGNTPVYGNPPV